MKNLNYFFRAHRDEIIAHIVNIIALGLAYLLRNNAIIFILSLIVFIISLFLVIYIRTKDKEFYFVPFTKPQNRDTWIGKGRFEYLISENSFLITNADPGYIFANCLNWSNYKCSFEFKIINTCLGVILKAINLSNYIMLQITPGGIRPHIRVNGAWQVWEHKDVGLSFSNKLEMDRWYRCAMVCEKDFVKIQIYDNNRRVFNRHWTIPSGQLVFAFKKDENDQPVNIPFSINLEFGSIGFRNSSNEKALLRNLLVEKLI